MQAVKHWSYYFGTKSSFYVPIMKLSNISIVNRAYTSGMLTGYVSCNKLPFLSGMLNKLTEGQSTSYFNSRERERERERERTLS